MDNNIEIEITGEGSEDFSKVKSKLENAINKRANIKQGLDEAIDASTEFGYELGVIEERERWADTLEKLISRVDDGDVAINEALAYLSSMTIKDSSQD